MKKIFKLIGIIALVAVIGFSIAACGDSGGDNNNNNNNNGNNNNNNNNGNNNGNNNNNNNNNTMAWTKVSNSPFSGVYAIAYGNNTFVAVGSDRNGGIIAYSSDNGVTWTAVANTTFNTSDGIYGIAFGNGTFVAGSGGGKIAYSSDGVTWTASTQMKTVSGSNLLLSQIEAIAFGNGTFIVADNNRKIVYSSDNGITWTAASTITDNSLYVKAIVYDGNGMFVAGCETGKIAYSTDNGVTWTAVNTGSIFDFVDSGMGAQKATILTIAYGNGKFVAGSNMGHLATSTDGKTWTAVTTTALGTTIYAIAFGNGMFVGGGLGDPRAQMATSTDGVTWTSFQTGTNQSGYWNAIGFGNSRFVAGYSYGGIDYSTGGGTGGNNNPQTATYTGTSGGTTYTLKTTGNTATAQVGDTYELTIGTKTSTGTVSGVSGSVLTLKPSNAATTFTATVSGTSITALNGTITWTDNTTASAPGTFTGGTNPGTGSGGTFTLTGIPEQYNGMYADITIGDTSNTANFILVYGYNILDESTWTLARISNGRVVIPLWKFNTNNSSFVRYTGNDTLSGTVNFYAANDPEGDDDIQKMGTFSSVTFSNGSATKSWNDALLWH